MDRCLYRDYEQTFLLAREALLAGDRPALRALNGAAEDREVREAMAALLALSDAKRGSPLRPVAQVCQALGAFCSGQGCPQRQCGVPVPARAVARAHRCA